MLQRTRLGGRVSGHPSDFDLPSVQRAGPSYTRFLIFLEAWILSGVKDCIALRFENVLLNALRLEASADLI